MCPDHHLLPCDWSPGHAVSGGGVTWQSAPSLDEEKLVVFRLATLAGNTNAGNLRGFCWGELFSNLLF